MRKTIFGLTAACLLAGCGGGAGGGADANQAATAASNEAAVNYQAAVLELSEEQRNVVMIRAIRDAGIQCQSVTGSEQIRGEGLTYRARCADGANHVVSIAADGNGQVVSAGAAAAR
jgi:hypothetical protein